MSFDLRSSLKNARFRSTLSRSVIAEHVLRTERTRAQNGDAIETTAEERMARAANDASIFLFFCLLRIDCFPLASLVSFFLSLFFPPNQNSPPPPAIASIATIASVATTRLLVRAIFSAFPGCRKKGKIEKRKESESFRRITQLEFFFLSLLQQTKETFFFRFFLFSAKKPSHGVTQDARGRPVPR